MQSMDVPAYVSKCIFFEGVHMFPGPDCPHHRESDEQGEIPPPGWTVQQ